MKNQFWNKKDNYGKFECHTGTIKVFTDPQTNLPFYGGGTSRELAIYMDHLILTLAGLKTWNIAMYNLDAPELNKYNNPVIDIDCSDYKAPNHLSIEFWKDLLKRLRLEYTEGRIKAVTVCCMGGHGRTGMALSILAGLTKAVSTDPVEFVRANYCKKAVESKAQLEYVEKITGIKVEAKLKKNFYSSGYVGSYFWEDEDKKNDSITDDVVNGDIIQIEYVKDEKDVTVYDVEIDEIDDWVSKQTEVDYL